MMFRNDELEQGNISEKLRAYRKEQHETIQSGLERVAECPEKQRLFLIQRA